MPNSQTPRFISLRTRCIVLRMIVISSLSSFVTGVVLEGLFIKFDPLFIGLTIPFLVILHHILRLWPRKFWSVGSDLIYSAVEFFVVTGCITVEGIFGAWTFPMAMVVLAFVWLSLCASLAFTIWNYRISQYRTMGHTYDFMENGALPIDRRNLSTLGRWSLLFGENALKRRFGMDRRFIRGLRTVFAILCFLAMITLGYFVLLIQPITPQVYLQTSRIQFMEVDQTSPVNVTLHVRVLLDTGTSGVQPETPSLHINFGAESPHIPCQYSDGEVTCTLPSPVSVTPFPPDEFTITINYTRALQDVSASSLRTGVHLNFDADPKSALHVIYSGRNALAMNLYPGHHLFGATFYSYEDTYASSGGRVFGIPHFNHRLVGNIQALIPDTEYIQSDSDNTTATLRLTYRGTQTWYKIEQEQSSSTLLSGFALLGGAWTFINGLFATVFGCTLLLVLFGIKPLSIYGLVHLFQRRGSLADGGYTLSDEDRNRIIAVLREHLLDSDGDIEDGMALKVNRQDGEPSRVGDAA